jgi:hypothetical protein
MYTGGTTGARGTDGTTRQNFERGSPKDYFSKA